MIKISKIKKEVDIEETKSGSKRAYKRRQSTSNGEAFSNSKASANQSKRDNTVDPPGIGVNFGSKDGPTTSNSFKKPRAPYSRKNQNTEKPNKAQGNLPAKSKASSQSADQDVVIIEAGQQQKPVSKSRAKKDPKNSKKEKQDHEPPTRGGSRKSRKNAVSVTGSTSSTKLISKQVVTGIVDLTGSPTSNKKATHEPNLTIKFDSNKAIRKEPKGSAPPSQRGLKTTGKQTAGKDFSNNCLAAPPTAKSNSDTLAIQRGPQNSRKTTPKPTLERYQPNKTIKKEEDSLNYEPNSCNAKNTANWEVKYSKFPVKGSSQNSKNTAARKGENQEVSSGTGFHPQQIIEVDNSPQLGSPPIRKAAPVSSLWRDLDLIDLVKVKEEDSHPIQWGGSHTSSMETTPEFDYYANFDPNRNIEEESFSTQYDPCLVIEEDVQQAEITIKEETEDPQLYLLTQLEPDVVIKKEKRAADLPLYNPQWTFNWSAAPTFDSLAVEDPWANMNPDMFSVEQEVDTKCMSPCQPPENNGIDLAGTSQDGLEGRIQCKNQNNGLYEQSGSKNESGNHSVDDAIDARLGAELASLFPGGEPMPEPEKKPAGAKETEAAIDARLQAELDSLPFVEAPVENDDDFVVNLLNSIINPGQQTANQSNVSQVFPPSQLPTASNQPVAADNPVAANTPDAANKPVAGNKPVKVDHGTHKRPPQKPLVRHQQRPLSQVPMVAQLTGLQGQVVSLTYTTAPDGLVTSVCTKEMPPDQINQLQSLSADQLHQILQSGQPYLALPRITPGGQEELGIKDASGVVAPTGQAVEDEEVDYEEIGVADTFAEYWPSKLRFGMGHPDPVVETATLSSVEMPDITYQLALAPRTTNCLSALQLEAVIYACQAHEQILPSGERAGFLLGDGAGVGKGRAIAGIIFDNYMKGRQRALWVSVSNDLKFDAERDLNDIGADDHIQVVAINKFKYSRIDSDDNDNFTKGVIFCTYTALIGESLTGNSKYKTRLRQLLSWLGKKFDGVIVFDECHKAKNLSLMNVGKSTKTGTTVLDLQKQLPHARVVYASATGASEPRNMAYMVRLGLWGPGTAYSEFYEFVHAVEKRGIGAMEIVAMDMKLRGTYISRQLSFKDVTFRIEEVAMSKDFRKTYNLAAELWAEINKKFLKACRLMCIENRVQKIITCQFWCAHQRFFKNLCIASKVNHVVRMTRQATRMNKAVVIGLQSTGESRTLEHLERHKGRLSSFVSTAKMIIQSFVEKHFPAPKRNAFQRLLNTGVFEPEQKSRPPRPKRAKMSVDWVDDDMDAEAEDSDIEMYANTMYVENERVNSGRKRRGRPPKAEKVDKITMQERILQHLCNNMRAHGSDIEATYTFDNSKLQKANITEHDVERCIRAREMLLDKIEVLGRRMPSNTLDKLIAELGGTKLVAEMTGRRGRVVRSECDGYKYEPRCESDISMDLINYQEKQRFMRGEKFVAIISEAASSGISLQSDKRVDNKRRRLHITLELPWSADRAVQQFGRTHRSNQVNSPEYVFIITDLAGERRFASTVAKRLESLGALTQGDRRATDARDLSQFNIDNSIGRSALENVMQQLTGEKPLDHASVPASYKGDFFHDCTGAMAGVGMLNVREENKVKLFSVEKDSNNISKFLNRILGCRVEIQNALFKFFLDKMYSLILQMKRKGHFDLGILDLDAHGACVKSVNLMRFTRKHATGTAATELHTVTVERGMSYETALAKYRKEGRHDHDGFYVLQQRRQNKNSSILCLHAKSNKPEGPACTSTLSKISLQLYRPNTGPQVRLETVSSILSRYVKVEPDVAREFWQQQYDVCLDKCSHVYWNRVCPFPAGCEVGLRVRPYHVLSGLMLPIWDRIEVILEKSSQKIQIIRVKTNVNKKIVGTVVPHAVYDALVADLSADSIVESHKYDDATRYGGSRL